MVFANRESEMQFLLDRMQMVKKPIGMEVLRDFQRKVFLIPSEGNSTGIRLGLFSRSGFTKEIEDFGRKGVIELIDVRKVRV